MVWTASYQVQQWGDWADSCSRSSWSVAQSAALGTLKLEKRLLLALSLLFSISLPFLHSLLLLQSWLLPKSSLLCSGSTLVWFVLVHPNLVQFSQLDQSSAYFLFKNWQPGCSHPASFLSISQASQLYLRNVPGIWLCHSTSTVAALV